MKPDVKRLVQRSALALLAVLGQPAFAGSPEAESQVEAARQKLDAAAQELSRAVAAAYAHPKGQRAFLGILLEDHDGDERGVTLSGVTPGGGAASAGLAAGDTLVGVEDVVLTGLEDAGKALMKRMENVKPGDEVKVTYLRGGKEYKAEITTTGMFNSALAAIEPKLAPWIEEQGIRGIAKFMLDPERHTAVFVDVRGDLAEYFNVKSGVLVLHVPERKDGLKAGDIVIAIGGQAPANANDAQTRMFAGSEPKPVRVLRKRREQDLGIDPDDYRVDGQTRVFVYKFDDLLPPPAPVAPPSPNRP
jgi:S1-C subfamily serine protease